MSLIYPPLGACIVLYSMMQDIAEHASPYQFFGRCSSHCTSSSVDR